MNSFDIVYRSSVRRDWRKLPRNIVANVKDKINQLKFNPFPPNSKKLTGTDKLYRLRIGDYRVIYEIDQQAERITIRHIFHRQRGYGHLERR